MPGIREYIKEEIFKKRLTQSSVLVVYDSDNRYRDLCAELADESVAFVDASERGIESREEAMQAFGKLVSPQDGSPNELLIYVPKKPPITEEKKIGDPFSAYWISGAIFPGRDGDTFLNLSIKAKPGSETEIRAIFEEHNSPSFELLDSLGEGVGYPTLRTLLGVDSETKILQALMVPNERQKEDLDNSDVWVNEVRVFLNNIIGLKLQTRGRTWSSIAEELWRFVLLSEFVFDLPVELPDSLTSVPQATREKKSIIYDLCDTIRNMKRESADYIVRAEKVELELKLPEIFPGIIDLGERDTFPFEERTFLAAAAQALHANTLDETREILDKHQNTVWVSIGESQAQWGVIESAMQLVIACKDVEQELSNVGSLDSLVEFYVVDMLKVDRLQRVFEQAANDCISLDHTLDNVIVHARRSYGKWIEKTQVLFTKLLAQNGWPLTDKLYNAEVFDRFVSPVLQEKGRRIAYLMVDALRYELGAELHHQLIDSGVTELHYACAALPTVTDVGMASLLPNASAQISLKKKEDGYEVNYGNKPVETVPQRMGILREQWGDRFAETTLSNFINSNDAFSTDLLVLRSTEIDSNLENNPDTNLGSVNQTLKSIRVAIHKLKELGFNEVVIVSDHGFVLNSSAEAGDTCSKPPGQWITVHDRALIGKGSEDEQNIVVPTEKLGIKTDFSALSTPKAMVPYRRGVKFFHGGPSLQEAIVPVITLKLKKEELGDLSMVQVELTYKGGAKHITTRFPSVELSLVSVGIFDTDIEILLEAIDKKGNVVGEAKRGGRVDTGSGTVTMKGLEKLNVIMSMNIDFHGKFSFSAFDPRTMTKHASISMETDYAV